MSAEVKPFILKVDVVVGDNIVGYTINNAVSWDISGDRAHGDLEITCEKLDGMTERFFGNIICARELPLEPPKED